MIDLKLEFLSSVPDPLSFINKNLMADGLNHSWINTLFCGW